MKVSEKSDNTRKQFIGCVKKYLELHELIDLARASTLGRPKLRSTLVSIIRSIYEDDVSTREELTEDLEFWYSRLADAFYEYCDGLSQEEGMKLIESLDGARYVPPIRNVVEKIMRLRENGSQNEGEVRLPDSHTERISDLF